MVLMTKQNFEKLNEEAKKEYLFYLSMHHELVWELKGIEETEQAMKLYDKDFKCKNDDVMEELREDKERYEQRLIKIVNRSKEL